MATHEEEPGSNNVGPNRKDNIFTHLGRLLRPSNDALRVVALGEEMLRGIAEEHRRQQFEHTDAFYAHRDQDPTVAEEHHEKKYVHMGIAASIERALNGTTWASGRPEWMTRDFEISAEVHMLGIPEMEERVDRDRTLEEIEAYRAMHEQFARAGLRQGILGLTDEAA